MKAPSAPSPAALRACALLALVAGGLALCALKNSFVLDDQLTIVDHPVVRGAAPWWRVFEYDYFGAQREVAASYGAWRPLQTLLFRLDHALGGGAAWPFRVHAALLYAVATYAFGRAALAVAPARAAVAATAFFAVHPLHTDAVFAAANRCEMTTFVLALGVLAAHRRDDLRGAALATLALAAAALSKESAVVILPTLLLHDLTHGRRPSPRLAARYVALAAVIGLAALLRRYTCGSFQGFSSNPIMNPLRALPWAAQRIHGVRLLGHAAEQFIAPTDLSTLYGPGSFPLDRVADGALALGAATLLGPLVLAWRARRAAPWVAFASLAFVLTAGAVCSVFALYSVMYAERLMLLPSAFAALLFGAALDRVAASRPRVAHAAAGVVLVGYAALFALRAPDWRDARALGRATVAVHPDDAFALATLGVIELAAQAYPTGYGYCRAATVRAPRFAFAWGCVGAALAAQGYLQPAAEAFARMHGGHFATAPFEGQYARLLVTLGRRDEAVRQLASMHARGLWGADADLAVAALRAPPRAPASR